MNVNQCHDVSATAITPAVRAQCVRQAGNLSTATLNAVGRRITQHNDYGTIRIIRETGQSAYWSRRSEWGGWSVGGAAYSSV